jgi:VanZ family protein
MALLVVLALTLIPRPPAITAEVNDKVEHATAFLVLAALGMIGWPSRRLVCVIALAVIGAAIELLQGTTLIHRDMSLLDWIADLLGIGIGASIVIVLGLSQQRSRGLTRA